MTKQNYTLKVKQQGKEVSSITTSHFRRFLNSARTINWQLPYIQACLRVSYGNGSWNDGEYSDKNDFWLALQAFREVGAV